VLKIATIPVKELSGLTLDHFLGLEAPALVEFADGCAHCGGNGKVSDN
jgi:hypothetical protein